MKKKCNACGHRFYPAKEKIYTAETPRTIIEALSSAPQHFDMVDCPKCGCQVALAVRMPGSPEEKYNVEFRDINQTLVTRRDMTVTDAIKFILKSAHSGAHRGYFVQVHGLSEESEAEEA